MTKIILPDRIFGRNVDGAMEKVLNGDKSQPDPTLGQTAPQANAPNLNGYIWVPSIKLHVAKERTLPNLTWIQTQEELKKQKLAMPTPYQFREFLKHIRDSKDSEHQKVFKDVVEVREPWRAQWLNAKFKKRKNELYMISENVLVNGKYQNVEQKLDDFLTEDKSPGISLDDWINSSASHGLPIPKNPSGKLYYWAPAKGYVAWFVADSAGADLGCYGRPGGSNASLGVRACAEGAVQK